MIYLNTGHYRKRVAILPHRCEVTDTIIWPGQIAYMQSHTVIEGSPFDDVIVRKIVAWYSYKGFMIKILKGEVDTDNKLVW